MPAPPAPPCLPPRGRWLPLVDLALEEDIGPGDVTSRVSLEPETRGRARIEARAELVACGLPIAAEVFRRVDAGIDFSALAGEGVATAGGAVLAEVTGPMRSILTAERTALNFLGRMCGIATLTARFVEAVRGTETAIVDTRKTLPGFRALDKYAVAAGGGVNHRIGLFDGVLLKDNHVAAAGSVEAAVKAALARTPANLRIQVEVESEAQAEAAIEAGAEFLLLDNLAPDAIRPIVERFGSRAVLEASGGISLENVRAYAETGVHRVSIGALTHSPRAADVALEVTPGGVPG
ncbi:MAG: carboxylating nicotinate-nucleotide diphosphorylase [Myxococcota bacterium]